MTLWHCVCHSEWNACQQIKFFRRQKGSDSSGDVVTFVALSDGFIYFQRAEQKKQLNILFVGADCLNYI